MNLENNNFYIIHNEEPKDKNGKKLTGEDLEYFGKVTTQM